MMYTQTDALSLAILPCEGVMSITESWNASRHAVRCTSSVSVFLQCGLYCVPKNCYLTL